MIGLMSQMMSRRGTGILAALTVTLMCVMTAGCIKNDLPYPRIPQYITELAAVGESAPARLDTVSFSATVYLDESVDITAVRFDRFSVTEGARCNPDLLEGTYDLSVPMVVTLTGYQTYQWVLKGEQAIDRRFVVEGEMGATVIDEKGHRIIVTMPETADLSALTLESVKLGPEGLTTMVPDLKPGPIDLSQPLRVTVTAHGRSEDWTIYAERSESAVALGEVNAWSCVIWAYAEAPATGRNGFQYRVADDGTWTDVPEGWVTHTGGTFAARITGLTPLTEYEVRAYTDGEYTPATRVATQATEVLPDGSFDEWWLDGKVWCPWNEGGVRFWDTGNKGAATLGESNVQPSDHVPPGLTGSSACLATKFVGVFGIGKLAAGSIYTGSFQRVDGTNGILDFGRPWKLRPTRLKGYYQYTTAPINYVSSELAALKDRPDTCAIYIALTDWTAPYEIRTNPKDRQLFDPSSPSVIAYGSLERGSDTDGYEEFDIELEYRSTSRVPSYIQITVAASKYGDYFTGGTGATLYVDQFSLEYDY